MASILKYRWYNRLWWQWMTGYELILPWPDGWVYLDNHIAREATPDDAYKLWFDENVGKQGIDWDWFQHPRFSAYILNVPRYANDCILIKIRKGKGAAATLAKLTWL